MTKVGRSQGSKAHRRAERIDGDQPAIALDMPEAPAIAACGVLHGGADFMDRAALGTGDECAVGGDHRADAAQPVMQDGACGDHALFD